MIRTAPKKRPAPGRPPLGDRSKRRVTLRLDPDVIDKFRATGPGWQARMNDALKAANPDKGEFNG